MTDNQTLRPGSSKEQQGDTEHLDFDFDIHVDDADIDRMSHEEPVGSADKQSTQNDLPEMSLFDEEAPEEPKKKTMVGFYAIGIIAAIVVLAIFVYFAMKVLGGGQSAAAPATPTSSFASNEPGLTGSDTANGNGFQAIDPSADAMALEAALNGRAIAPTIREQAEPLQDDIRGVAVGAIAAPSAPVQAAADTAAPMKDIVITYGAESLAPETSPAEALLPAQPAASAAVTDEERMYDSLLSTVDNMGVPPEAIKIDQTVINRRLETQRLSNLEEDVKAARQSISTMHGAVEGLRSQVADFAKIIEKSSVEQASVSASITQLSDELKKVSAEQDREIKALREAVSKVQLKAEKAEAKAGDAAKAAKAVTVQQSAQQPKLVTVSQPHKPVAPMPQQVPALSATTKVLAPASTPATVNAPVAATEPRSSQGPAQCDGSRVSAVWRVKGVNSHSAYIVRSQDQEGLYLKLGLEVPGYGQVLSFNAADRSVCTTSGLIRR